MLRFLFLLILTSAPLSKGHSSWTSPCSDLFHYENSTIDKGQWIGEFTLKTEEELVGVWMRIVFDPAPTNVESDFGFIKPQTTIFPTAGEYLLRKTNHVLKPGEVLNVTIRVHFNDTSKVPLLVGFRLNGDPICPEDKIIDPTRLIAPENVNPARRIKRQGNPQWVSPCPSLFTYDLNSLKPGEWSGDINLSSDSEIEGVWIRLTLEPRPQRVEADFSVVESSNGSSSSGEYLIRKSDEKLLVGEKWRVKLRVFYDKSGPVPLLVGFRLNGNLICPENAVGVRAQLESFPSSGGRDFLIRKRPNGTTSAGQGGRDFGLLPGLVSRPNDGVSNQKSEADRFRMVDWESPCPDLFRYDLNSLKDGEWSGDLTLRSETELGGIWVRLTIDPKPISVEADLGVVDGRASSFPTAAEYLIRKTNTKLSIGQVLNIRLKVNYDPTGVVPLLVGFRLNGDPVCPDDKIIDPSRLKRPLNPITPPQTIQTTTVVPLQPQRLESPCPETFSYENVDLNEWTGIINLKGEEELGGIWIRMTIDPKPLSLESDFGSVDSRMSVYESSLDYLIRKTNQRLLPGQSLQIRIRVRYDPSRSIPLLVGFRLNGDPICPDDKIIDPARVKRPFGSVTETSPELFTPPPLVTSTGLIGKVPEVLESPCPELFAYGSVENGRWDGVITLRSDEELGGIWVRLTIDPKPLKVESDFGSTDFRVSPYTTAGDYLIRKTNEKLSPGQTLRIKLKVEYDPNTPIPLLIGFRLNGDPICPDDKIIDPTRIKRPGSTQITPPPLLPPNPINPSPSTTGIINIEKLVSPCPDMFYIDQVKNDEWTGVIDLQSENELNGIWVRLTIDPKPLSVESDFGSTDPRSSAFPTAGEYLIRKTNEKLSPGGKLKIRIKVGFDPTKPVPILIGYRLNGDPICPDDKIIDPSRINNQPGTSTEFVPPSIVVPSTTIDYVQVLQEITPKPSSGEWVSPCPDYFQYDKNVFKDDSWTGVFTITPEEELGGVWIRVTIDPKPTNVTTDFGSIDPRSSNFPSSADYLIRKTNQKVLPGERLDVRMTVRYDPGGSIPVLVGFRLNGDPVCPDDKVIDPTRVQRPIKSDFTTKPTTYRPPFKNPNSPTVPSVSNPETNLFSPCPNVFNYEPIVESNRWFGKITWRSNKKITVPHIIKIIIDAPATQLGNWYGETITTDNKEFIIFGQKPIQNGEEMTLRFFVRYSGGVPKLRAIIVNDETICGSIRLASSSEASSEVGVDTGGLSYQINRFKNYILVKRGDKATFIKIDNPNVPIIIV